MIAGTDLLKALPVAVYVTDAEGRITFYNEAAAELWGHRPQLGNSQWCGSWRLYRTDGTSLPHDECPMAITLKTGEPVRGVEAVAERPDGTRIPFLPYPTALRDGTGQVIGAINMLVDLRDRVEADVKLARLAAIVVSSDDAIVSKTLEGRVTSWNAGAERIFGYTAAEMIGQPILRLIPPELHREEHDILAKLRRGEHIRHYETVRVTRDGRRIDISLSLSPLRDRRGSLVGASKVARDITERKHAERLQQILVEELNHRVKNTLATVQAIANQSLLRARQPADFVKSFTGRVQALATAHTMLTHTKMQGTELMELIREQVLLGGSDQRISIAGPLLMLDAQATLHLALVLHELATNARKYGALSGPHGRLSLTWEIRGNGDKQLLMHWSEKGAGPVRAPTERGYGSALIEQTLRSSGGKATVRFGTEGVSWDIDMPLPKETRPAIDLNSMSTLRPMLLEAQSQQGLSGKRILVIEDEPLIAMDLESMLAGAGCEIVGPAANVAAAKTLIGEGRYDAALLDVNLAGQPVDELAAALTQRNCPFAFVTGYGRDALPRGFREALVLSKPFSEERLLATAELLLCRRDGVVPLRQKAD